MTKAVSRIPSLDGLRTISVAFVLLGHLSGTRGYPAALHFLVHYADFGVRAFFVISGFLITTLLLKEHEETGNIHLAQFYLRRAYRILPAAYCYIAVVTIAYWASIKGSEAVYACLYLTNYIHSSWPLGHLWSLSVEEQFYLLWPFVLAFFYNRRKSIVIGVIAAGPAMRVLFHFTPFRATAGVFFPTVADALATGCLLAICQPTSEPYARIFRSRWMLIAPIIALTAQSLQPLNRSLYYVLGITIINCSLAVTTLHVMRRPYCVLNAYPMVYIGVLSYSLYVCQQPFLNRTSTSLIATFPLNITLAVMAALACHYGIEQPFLTIRSRRMEEGRRILKPAEAAGAI